MWPKSDHRGAVFEAKFMLPWSFSEEAAPAFCRRPIEGRWLRRLAAICSSLAIDRPPHRFQSYLDSCEHSRTRGAWSRQWRLVSLDGSTIDVADEAANDAAFGRPGASRGSSAYPQIRFVSLVEDGTHVLFASQMAGYGTGEITLAKAVLASLKPGMLCLADRQFFGVGLWNLARGSGADLLWRIKKNTRLACEQRLPDGSHLSHIYPRLPIGDKI